MIPSSLCLVFIEYCSLSVYRYGQESYRNGNLVYTDAVNHLLTVFVYSDVPHNLFRYGFLFNYCFHLIVV